MRNWFITAFLFVSYISFSQSNFLLNKFEVENISSENVKSIFLDKNNFFWISTSDGINRYDGSLNSIYKSNPFDSTTLSNNSVLETFQISDDGLFIKSTSGLDYFSYSKNTFQRIDIDAPISQTKYDNSLIITSKNDGVFILNLEDFSTKNLKFDPRNPLSISSSNFNNNQNQVTLPVNDDIWIGTSYGLNKYNIKTDLNKRFYETNADNTLNSNIINDLFYVEEDLSGSKISISNKILASTQNGLSLINPENDEIYNYPSLTNSNIYNIFTLDGDILIHNENGIFLIKTIDEEKINLEKISNSSALSKVRKISNNEFILYSSSSNLFKRIIKSKKNYLDLNVDIPVEFKINDIRNYKGAYYIATENGIYKVTEKLNSLSKKNEDLLSNEKIISIQENDYYRAILTNSRLLLYEEDEIYYTYNLSKLIGEKNIDQAALYLEEDEYLYIGTNKLFIVDLYAEETIIYETSQEGLNSLMEGEINNFSLLIDDNFSKELWISLSSGISILNIDEEPFQNFNFNLRTKNK